MSTKKRQNCKTINCIYGGLRTCNPGGETLLPVCSRHIQIPMTSSGELLDLDQRPGERATEKETSLHVAGWSRWTWELSGTAIVCLGGWKKERKQVWGQWSIGMKHTAAEEKNREKRWGRSFWFSKRLYRPALPLKPHQLYLCHWILWDFSASFQ